MAKGLFSQMSGAFVRQIGREAAHSAYKGASNQQMNGCISFYFNITYRKATPGNPHGMLKVFNTFNLICLVILNILPFVSLITLIRGIKRLITKRIPYFNEKLGAIKVPITDCPNEDVKLYRLHGRIYIIIALLAIFFKGYAFVQYANQTGAEHKARKQQTEQMMQWNSYTIVNRDDFRETETTRTFEYIYPTYQKDINTNYLFIREDDLFLYATSIHHIASFQHIEFKIYHNGEPTLIDGDFDKNICEQSDKLTLNLYGKEYKYDYRYLFSGDLHRRLIESDSLTMRIDDKHYYTFHFANPKQ